MQSALRTGDLFRSRDFRDRPLQSVRVRRREPADSSARDRRRNQQADQHRPQAHSRLRGRQSLRTRARHERNHDRSRQSLDNADRKMDRRHQQDERAQRQFGYPGRPRLQHDAERAKLKANDGRDDRRRPRARRAALYLRDRAIHKRIRDERRIEPEIEDVTAQSQETAVRKEERLNREHRRDHEKRRIRPQQDRQDQAAAEMPARTGARNREVDHLRGEDERAEHAHHRNQVVAQRQPHLPRAVRDQPRARRPHRPAHGGGN